MESIKKNKMLLSVFFVTFSVFIYFFFFNGNGTSNHPLSDTIDTSQSVQEEVIGVLSKINKIQIDQTLFTTDVWLSLKDRSIPLLQEIPGKNDLFSPIGSR